MFVERSICAIDGLLRLFGQGKEMRIHQILSDGCHDVTLPATLKVENSHRKADFSLV